MTLFTALRAGAILTTAVAGGAAALTARGVAATAAAAEPEPTGASLAWTSDDPVVVEARGLITAGRLADAERLLRRDDPAVSAAAGAARAESLELVSRIRYDYPLAPADLLARLRKDVPSLAADQLDRWRGEGGVQWRPIDGRVAYFRREPKNMARFCPEYMALVRPPRPSAAAAGGWRLADHLRRVVHEAERTGRPDVLPVTVRYTFTLTVPTDAPGMKPGARVRAWLPFPQEYGNRQYAVRLVSASPADPEISPAATGEHPLGGAPQRAAYFERRVPDPPKPAVFREVVEFTSRAYCPALDEAEARPLPADYADGNLGERPPHVAFTPRVKAAVAEAVGDEANPWLRPAESSGGSTRTSPTTPRRRTA
jgi:hypothetical protein